MEKNIENNVEKKKKGKAVKVIIVLFILFVLFRIGGGDSSTTSSNNAKFQKNNKAEVKVVDFSTMQRDAIENWSNENKVNYKILEEYSDTVEKGGFISQSVNANTTIHEGDNIKIVYSLGKKPPVEYTNALKKAETYSETLHMSKKGIYQQLTSQYGEKFSKDAAQYAIDNINADFNKNALEKAKIYRDTMSMSKNAIYKQLISDYGEKFEASEAQYAIDHLEE